MNLRSFSLVKLFKKSDDLTSDLLRRSLYVPANKNLVTAVFKSAFVRNVLVLSVGISENEVKLKG